MKLLPLLLSLITTLLLSSIHSFAQSAAEKDTISVETAKMREVYRIGSVKLKKKEVKELLGSDQEALRKFRSGQALNYTGIAVCAGGTGLFLYAVGDAIDKSIHTERLTGGVNDKSSMNWTYFGAGIGAMVPGALMMIIGKDLRVKAVRKYNNSIEGGDDRSSIYLRPSYEGIGLTLVF